MGELDLWNEGVSLADYEGSARVAYQQAILDEYRLHLDSADKTSGRRTAVNSFFLTLNGAVLTVIGVFWRDRPTGSWLMLVPFLVTMLLLCYVWRRLIEGYMLVTNAKYYYLRRLEEKLPARFLTAERELLERGFMYKVKRGFGESLVPACFGAAYIFAFAAILVGR